jgi:sec-independent protein translocase protein TatA
MLEAPSHWLILGLVVIAMFGYKALPDAARSLGHSVHLFNTEMKGIATTDPAENDATGATDLSTSSPNAASN